MQLQADQKAKADAAKAKEEEIRKAQEDMVKAIQKEERDRAATQAALQAEATAADAAAIHKAKSHRGRMESQERAAKATRERMAQALNRMKEQEAKRKETEAKAQASLRRMGVCPQGYQWVKMLHGYRCRGGAHFISNDKLGV